MISRLILLKMRNVLDKRCGENQNTHFMFNAYLSKPLRDNVEKLWLRQADHILQHHGA